MIYNDHILSKLCKSNISVVFWNLALLWKRSKFHETLPCGGRKRLWHFHLSPRSGQFSISTFFTTTLLSTDRSPDEVSWVTFILVLHIIREDSGGWMLRQYSYPESAFLYKIFISLFFYLYSLSFKTEDLWLGSATRNKQTNKQTNKQKTRTKDKQKPDTIIKYTMNKHEK